MPSGNKYKGQDRRLLKKTQKCLDLIEKRDTLVATVVASGKKTAAVSNRIAIVPPADTALVASFDAVKEQISDKLAETW